MIVESTQSFWIGFAVPIFFYLFAYAIAKH